MDVDLTKLTPGQIGAIAATATLLAALIASSASLAVALVNQWGARRLARYNAQRDFRSRQFEGLTAIVDEQSEKWADVLVSLSEGNMPEFRRRLSMMQDTMLVGSNIAAMTAVQLDPLIFGAVKRFGLADSGVRRLISECELGGRDAREVLDYLAKVHLTSAVALRGEINRFIFDGYPTIAARLVDTFFDMVERHCVKHGYPLAPINRIPGLHFTSGSSLAVTQEQISRSIDYVLGPSKNSSMIPD